MADDRIRIGDSIFLEYPEGKVGLIRCMTDPDQYPGDVEWSCAVVIDKNNVCTVNIFCGKRAPSDEELTNLKDYFLGSGCSGTWIRAKNGKQIKTMVIGKKK